ADSGLVPMATELTANNVGGAKRRNRPEDLDLLVAHRVGIHGGGRLHGQKRDHLQHVVLNYVADGPRFLVKLATALHAKGLGHGDLHAVDVIAVPDGLQKAIGETEDDEVL